MSSSATGTRLANKRAIITGGAAGFGAQIAQTFADQGAKVLITDINSEAGEKTASTHPSITFVKHDVTSSDAWKETLEHAIKELGGVDILVNNAGGTYAAKPTAEVSEKDWSFVFNLNVKSVFLGCNTIVPQMISQGTGGCIINIASVGASRPRPNLVWYNSTKGAVVNATKGLAAEYGKDKIRVNSVAPLLTNTQLFQSFVNKAHDDEEARKVFEAQVPLGRLGKVEDTANACLYLASEDAQFITGVNLKVDGGKCI